MNKDIFLERYGLATNHPGIETFYGFREAVEHGEQRCPCIRDIIPVSLEINTESIAGLLTPAGIEVVRYEGADAEGAFSKIGPFYLKVRR